MDATFILALTRQALAAYTEGGQGQLDLWKATLPPPHLAEFEQFCAEPLAEMIAAMEQKIKLSKEDEQAEAEPTKQRKSDPRRSKPI